MDISQFKDAFGSFSTNFGTFSTDFQKFTGDFATFLTKVTTNNPNDQADLDNMTTSLRGFGNTVAGMDSKIKEIDATINPAPPSV